MSQSLLPYNTFHVPSQTQELIIIDENTDLIKLLHNNHLPLLILGGGSNILLIHNRDGLTLINRIHGRQILQETDTTISLRIGAGENRHDIVMWTVSQGLRGIENLALIPGTVGASPIQNIGAYGVEVSSVIDQVHYIDTQDLQFHSLSFDECQFGYRDSVFKHSLKDRTIITAVDMTLSKSAQPILTYTGLDHLSDKPHLTPSEVSEAVIAIRSAKLPDWTTIGTAGSFFKNPIVDHITRDRILGQYPKCPTWAVSDTHHKLAAGRLLDHVLGLKGVRSDNSPVGCRDHQALVLVNYDNANGAQIRDRAQYIIDQCKQKLDITLEPEVNII